METSNKLAKEWFQHYKKVSSDLINTYCQARDNNPFDTFPEIAKAIWRTNVCLELWRMIAMKNEERRYYQGG